MLSSLNNPATGNKQDFSYVSHPTDAYAMQHKSNPSSPSRVSGQSQLQPVPNHLPLA